MAARLRVRRLRPDDWPDVLALADRLLSFPFAHVIRVNRSHAGWALVDADARLVFVQLTRVEDLGRVRVGLLGWALAEPDPARRASGRALQRLFDAIHAGFREAGCARFVVGDIDGYSSSSWRLAHAGGYRRWTTTQQLRLLGWRWPSVFWRLSHFGVRTFLLQRPADDARPAESPRGRGGLAACAATLFLGAGLLPLVRAGGLWDGLSRETWSAPELLACGAAVALHAGARAATQGLAARRRGLSLEFRAWDSGLVTAAACALAGVFVPGFAGAPYVRDARYDHERDPADFGGVRGAAALASLALSVAAALVLGLVDDASTPAAALLLAGLGFGLTDTLPLGGPWSATAAGHWRRRRPRAAWCAFALWCALLAFALAR